MQKNRFKQLLREENFKLLFIEEMGWSKFQGPADLTPIIIDDRRYRITEIAQMRSFPILQCKVDFLPDSALYRKLDAHIRANRIYDYICIFFVPGTQMQQWMVPIKQVEKRNLVTIEYNDVDKTDFLYSKLSEMIFEYGEQVTITDVKECVQHNFEVNSEKVTKDFYAGFRKEHKSFAAKITGMDDNIPVADNRNKQWYTSVMLNRLMFCYFIQKKGFLDNNVNYLSFKLHQTRETVGLNQFYSSFYKSFLTQLFHDGLNKPLHETPQFKAKFGRIPYLNGGMFDEHQLEVEYPNIDIPDEAFETLFDFFDKWNWHLDTRITASGKDINPDVLGYIFEQYINDRAAMGAYYTKEDITEYISKNCILPYLMDEVKRTTPNAFRPNGYVWETLAESGDKYIYDAVKKGVDHFDDIPSEIAIGLDTTSSNLLERRAKWNEKTLETWALPTEIWRESIERMQRCKDICAKISQHEITNINDFITYNLDIRQFVYDLLENSDDHLFVEHFYKALQNVTILDPTCGSGAFLFAALNILEPLYEVCIEKMRNFNANNTNLFKEQLEEIANKYRSNQQYFIYKSIILRNLYGVDIMVEATEIAKLRLFLKMVAVVEVDKKADNLGLDPLPDVDFNIRCGNSLVGYATENELQKDLCNGEGIFANTEETIMKIQDAMEKVAKTYNRFKKIQLETEGIDTMTSYKDAKSNLKSTLFALNAVLNQKMFSNVAEGNIMPFNKWMETHQPFHWLAEFYEIIQIKGGFDVIIGNPPYVEHSSKDVKYSLSHLESASCGNLYGNCIERGLQIGNTNSKFSFIIPVAITCSQRMDKVIRMLKAKSGMLLFANFDDRPGKLFEMIEHLRATIFISSRANDFESNHIFSTKYNRWYSEHRNLLFKQLAFVEVTKFVNSFTIPKFSTTIECNINEKIQNCGYVIASTYANNQKDNQVYYRAAGGGYFLLMKIQKSITYINGKLEDVKAEKILTISRDFKNTCIGSILSSTLFYWNYIGYTDCRNLTKSFIDTFHIPKSSTFDNELSLVGECLFDDYEKNKYTKNTTYKTTGRNVIYDEYYPKLSKCYIDEIDKVLARHYKLTDEELDFIINFDIKYRLGNELDSED